MIISPPYLLPRLADETDSAWIARCMPGGQPGDGAYPLSHAMQWHGGLHLSEPEPNAWVRAIADAELVFIRKPEPFASSPQTSEHAQAYGDGWTDNGVVVLRHQTEIGEGPNGAVTFYSVYMHLRTIDIGVRVNKRIYRKAPIGLAGQIYGQIGKLHFEIVCDDANLQRLVGRASGALESRSNGRVDAVYGTMHFQLPTGTPVYAEQPSPNNPVAHRQQLTQSVRQAQRTEQVRQPHQANTAHSAAAPAPQALQAVHTTAQALFVGLRYAAGEGAVAHRGDAFVSTCQSDGTRIGNPLQESEAEYNLYTSAVAISQAYPANARPAPSAVYELLRFGRVIGPDALSPANVPHWRRINYPGGTGWVNLNAANVCKFSDADFPHWLGWSLVDDSADQDSRCDSATVKSWLDANGDGKVGPAEARARMVEPSMAHRLARAICKFPTEWNAASVDRRLGWIKTSTVENPNPVDAANFERLRAHVAAFAFWNEGLGLPESHWHWNPREFIGQFRKCGWVDNATLQRLYPNISENSLSRFRIPLNQIIRKYFINISRHRMTHFLGQGAHESAQLNGMIEGGNTNGSRQPEINGWYDNPLEIYFNMYRCKNGNIEAHDGIKYRGRGMKQLTGRYNYGHYWAYRGWIELSSFTEPWWSPPRSNRAPEIPNPEMAGNDPFTTIDVGGWYWESTPIRGLNNGLGRKSSSVNTLLDRSEHSDELVRVISRQINGGEIGLRDRRTQTQRIFNILKD